MNPLVPAALLETLVQQTATDGKVSLLEIVRLVHCCVTDLSHQQSQVRKLMGELGWLPARAPLPGASGIARFAPECTDADYGAHHPLISTRH